MSQATRRWVSSYRVRLTVGYLAVVALVAVAWAWSLFGPLTEAIVEREDERLLSVARAGAMVLSETEAPLDSFVDGLVAETRLRVTVVAADGRVLADSQEDAAAMENHSDRPEVIAALRGEIGHDRRRSATQDEQRIYVAVPATYAGTGVALRVSTSLDEIDALARQTRQTGLLLLLGALAAALVVALRLSAIATEPISRLTQAADAMAAGNLAAPVPAVTGDLGVLSSALVDLREQMRMRLDDLEAEKRNLRSVLDGLEDAVLLLDGETVSFANEAAGRILRQSAVSARGLGIAGVGLPASIVADVRSHVAARTSASGDWGPDPGGRHLRVTVIPVARDEDGSRTIVSIADVTERVHVEAVRREFVANASHELKTPVAGIRLLAGSAAGAASEGDVSTALAFTAQIEAEAERLGRLVQDLLDLSRLETSPAEETITDLRPAIANALLSHRPAASERGLDLRFDDSTASGEDAYVVADPTDMAIALDNLLDNALKYTERGSVTISLDIDETTVSVAVADTGIGIPAEDLPRIFERFYRVDRARSRESGGTGLGLALVRHVAERSRGSVTVASTPGQGSTFRLTVPRAR